MSYYNGMNTQLGTTNMNTPNIRENTNNEYNI